MPARSFDRLRRIGVAFSEDDGRSWHWAAEIPAREETTPPSIMHAVEMPDRRVVVTSAITTRLMRERPFNANRPMGAELDQAAIGGCLGLPSHLLRLADGRA